MGIRLTVSSRSGNKQVPKRRSAEDHQAGKRDPLSLANDRSRTRKKIRTRPARPEPGIQFIEHEKIGNRSDCFGRERERTSKELFEEPVAEHRPPEPVNLRPD